MKWKETISHYFESYIKVSPDTKRYFLKKKLNMETVGIHLAVFNEPFLSLLLRGTKTVESRFSKNKVSPYDRVFNGDIVFVKKSGGPITGYFIVKKAHFYTPLTMRARAEIRKRFSKGICSNAVSDFWSSRSAKKYISLMETSNVKKIPPVIIGKKDRMAWVVIRRADQNVLF
jgi:hypothetical protein